ncbi:5'-nucleotidase C-terminal domain-containing protein [soil metagenome]
MSSRSHRRTLRVAWLATLLAALMLASLVAPAAASSTDNSQEPNPVDYTLTVLHNNDGESDLLASEDDADPGAGTISRFGYLVKDLRRDALRENRREAARCVRRAVRVYQRTRDLYRALRVLHRCERNRTQHGAVTVSAGDNFLASPELQASFDKGVPWYDAIALDSLNYDAFTIGNHEFDFGPEALADFINSFEGNDDIFLSANLDFSAVPALAALVEAGRIRPSVVVRERGERIGIIGATTPDLREVSSPGDVGIDDDLVGVIQAEVDRLTDRGIDKILVSSHLQNLDNELELVTKLSSVDAVIGGGGGEDLGDAYPLTATDAEGVTVPVVTVPGDYFDVGRLELDFNGDGEVVGFDGALEPVTSDLPQDEFILNNVEQPVTEFLESLDETVVATSEVGLNGVRNDVRTRETNLGSLLADAHLAAATARAAEFGAPTPQVGLQNGGGIRNDSTIGPGEVTALDTFDIAPFANFISVIEVSAEDFVAAVEHGLAGLPDPAGSFAHWSGLVVEYDPDAAAGSRVVNLTLDDGTEVVQGGQVMSDAPVAIATIDFLAAGNDGYDMFEAYDLTLVGVPYQQSLAEYLAGLGTVTAADYSDPVEPADRTRIIPTG